ncbi:very-long-chain (3R)-3-hydroxyacyl-CoA dehydratase 2-like isoform X1 [Pistacia vera]|uniref:very-long-chain (3R)-3-hydroxyacyl-CoA dehydratase 2-like isoform X1 n=1 Tax=Pistacia vera TaxID=55513 RepID=UPI0012634374|nr:very-long-chain (3R)-3-hydroxyacyl-CoA dehydratase 2-like isoform X1 [Pistacia vera]
MYLLSRLYLFTYNSLQALGWAVSLFSILSNILSTKSIHVAYDSAGQLIWLLQTCSFLEVIHGAIGIVPSGVLFPFLQWGGRTLFFLSIVRTIDEVQELPSVFITFVAWSVSEVIRYTAFIVLYPIGLFPGEMWLMYEALPYVKKKNLYADFFDVLPFSYYNFLRVMLLCYPFLWLKLYLHLFKQRGSKLGKHHKKKKQ